MNRLLPIRSVEKVWGLDQLPPPFTAPPGKRIGEIWFEPPVEAPELLIKYIFAGEKLSIQTHPSDSQTEAMGLGRQGKEECWLVLDAEPGATIGVGFHEAISADAMRAAALDGSIEDLLVWHAVRPGDFFYIPANTVHAIGGGVSILEVQQNSDITYRLYDYGRPRELHLDEGIAVAKGAPLAAENRRHIARDASLRLVEGPFFRLDKVCGVPRAGTLDDYAGPLFVLPTAGVVEVAAVPVAAGQCALADSLGAIAFEEGATVYLAQALQRSTG